MSLQRHEPRGHVRPAFDPELFRARFCLLRRADTLDHSGRAQLEALFNATRASPPAGPRSRSSTGSTSPTAVPAGAADRFCDPYPSEWTPWNLRTP